MQDTVAKIESFAALPSGWHYGKGGPADTETIRRAILTFMFIMTRGFTQTNAFPHEEGHIAVTAYANDYYLMIVVLADSDLYEIRYEKGDETLVDLVDIQIEELAIELGQIVADPEETQ